MVAYSFAPQFVEAIVAGRKRQTVRGDRRRHARPGEPLQLYTAMRTRQCRKLVTPDPICIDVRHIVIEMLPAAPFIGGIEIEGVSLTSAEIEEFAAADGFGGGLAGGFARQRMGEFWLQHHEWSRFIGVVVRWRAGRAQPQQSVSEAAHG